MNSAGTLQETLDSVRAQGYPDVEHIVVDGGSHDGTLEILDKTEGIRWISEPDEGRVDAANKGLRMATGDVVAWLNADDRYEPGALLAVGEALAQNPPAAWASGYCLIIDAAGREIRRAVTSYKSFLLRRWTLGLYLTQNFVSDPATFVRRNALEAIGALNPSYRTSHDYDLWLRVARRFGPPVIIRKPLASFRMAEGTLSMRGFEAQFAEHAAVARSHGTGHPLAVAVNRAMSGLIVMIYKALRWRRRVLSR
jgi:glycosyltransferase involved in cell wall biosynthesis